MKNKIQVVVKSPMVTNEEIDRAVIALRNEGHIASLLNTRVIETSASAVNLLLLLGDMYFLKIVMCIKNSLYIIETRN